MLGETDGDREVLGDAPWDKDEVAENDTVGDTVRDSETVRVGDGENEVLAVVLRELVEDVPAITQEALPGAQAVHCSGAGPRHAEQVLSHLAHDNGSIIK
jgi:hypothetical protein